MIHLTPSVIVVAFFFFFFFDNKCFWATTQTKWLTPESFRSEQRKISCLQKHKRDRQWDGTNQSDLNRSSQRQTKILKVNTSVCVRVNPFHLHDWKTEKPAKRKNWKFLGSRRVKVPQLPPLSLIEPFQFCFVFYWPLTKSHTAIGFCKKSSLGFIKTNTSLSAGLNEGCSQA